MQVGRSGFTDQQMSFVTIDIVYNSVSQFGDADCEMISPCLPKSWCDRRQVMLSLSKTRGIAPVQLEITF